MLAGMLTGMSLGCSPGPGMGIERQVRQHRGHRAALPGVPSKDFPPPPAPSSTGNIAGGVGAVQGQCCGEGRCPAPAAAPPRPFLGRSLLTDKHRFFLRHKVLVQPSTQSGSIIRWGTERRGRGGGGPPPHNAHKWRAGPPLLCLGRKGRDPRRGPLNGSIVSEPPRPLGSPLGACCVSPPTPSPAPAARLGQRRHPTPSPLFWGSSLPMGHPQECWGVAEGLSFREQSERVGGCSPLPGKWVLGLKSSSPHPVFLGDKKADLG